MCVCVCVCVCVHEWMSNELLGKREEEGERKDSMGMVD